MSNKLKIQVGKTYLDREGRRVNINRAIGQNLYPFMSDRGVSYTESGAAYTYMEVKHDLVSQVETDGAPEEIKVRYVLRETTKWSVGSAVLFKYVDVYLESKDYGPSTLHQVLELPEAAARSLCSRMS